MLSEHCCEIHSIEQLRQYSDRKCRRFGPPLYKLSAVLGSVGCNRTNYENKQACESFLNLTFGKYFRY